MCDVHQLLTAINIHSSTRITPPPVCKELLWVVVDQLAVDEYIHVMGTDQINLKVVLIIEGKIGDFKVYYLVLHLLLLRQLDFSNLADVVHLHSGAKHLDLVGVRPWGCWR